VVPPRRCFKTRGFKTRVNPGLSLVRKISFSIENPLGPHGDPFVAPNLSKNSRGEAPKKEEEFFLPPSENPNNWSQTSREFLGISFSGGREIPPINSRRGKL